MTKRSSPQAQGRGPVPDHQITIVQYHSLSGHVIGRFYPGNHCCA